MSQIPLTGILGDPRLSSQVLGDGSIVKYLQARLTADQEIRARALECAVRIWANPAWSRMTVKDFWADVREFEAYIRDGKS